MMRPALTIARYTLLEALRNRLLWLVLLMMAGAVAVSGFLNELALTESRQLQAALLGAVLRFAAVFLVATFVITSMAREANDKGLELLMALPMPRAVYLFGKLAGFGALAVLPALLFGALGLCFAPPEQAALWAFSLLCECWIVAAFSVLCMLTLNQVLPALAASFAFYLLARVIGALQLLGHGAGIVQSGGQQMLNTGIDGLALLLPHLDQFTRSDWLVYHSGSGADLATIAAQTAIYVALMAAAALFDLHRKAI
ncbi:ABC transporter permease [Duganella dendranthematis]|jgi:ABC-type transport system involved in multi-copper enzyme maturation permease subunit|uniref:ABC transporter permease n=1 Tax=Duganella dendranthematis TaxID=2728021 RepID=A0ABX6MEW4_9BURK|nr:ABC transporter permease subunit [Duganella dendranthematis]QJD92876.1 ABC transporter permease [Duganella dendranthematis]